MVIWINGAFGAGKTTLSNILLDEIPNSIIFDPEEVGGLIHRIVPNSKKQDFQDFKMWREIVVMYIYGLYHEFNHPIIVPMTLINPIYIDEIFTELKKMDSNFIHVYLEIEERVLRERISKQIIHPSDKSKDEWIKNWRLDKIKRCVEAKGYMPKDTIFLDSGKNKPETLVKEVLSFLSKGKNK